MADKKTEKKPRVVKPVDPNAPKCLNPECGRPQKVRGLCVTCYTVARKAVNAGETSWEKLVDAGKCLGRGVRNGTRKAQARAWLLKEAAPVEG